MNMGSFVKGMGVGVTMGAITYAVTNTSSKQKKRMKRSANRAIRTVANVMDGISFMVK